MREIWKTCHLLENYQISNLGNVKNLITGITRTLSLDSKGYYFVALTINKIRKNYSVHQLVLFAFKPSEYFEGAVVNHIDGNKLNNSLDNLEWVTIKENCQHAIETGLCNFIKYGLENKNSKLKPEDISLVREEYNKIKNYTQVGKMFGISDNAVRKIIKGTTWKK